MLIMTLEQKIAAATRFIDGMENETDTIELGAEPISGSEIAYWMMIWLDDLWLLDA